MTARHRSAKYPLGHTDAEHERLIRQAARVGPITERFFREAGIGPGQRVLDLGSGVGDVAMLVARLVGPSGEVVAVERDRNSIAKARARVTEAGFHNVNFNESNVSEIPDQKPFDASRGPFYSDVSSRSGCGVAINFTSSATGRSVCFSGANVGPGHCAFGGRYLFGSQRPLSLTRRCALLPITTWERSFTIHSSEAGLPEPTVRMELPMGKEPYLAQWYYDTLCSLLTAD